VFVTTSDRNAKENVSNMIMRRVRIPPGSFHCQNRNRRTADVFAARPPTVRGLRLEMPGARPLRLTPGSSSPLNRRVVAINVQVGQAVKEGDHVLTLEAMKMNTNVFSPHAGTVAALKVAVGDAAEEGQTLMTLA
jgi:biotin carboxyl carrier protein